MLAVVSDVTENVSAILTRAMGETSRDALLDDYRSGRGPRLFGWSAGGKVVCVAGVATQGSAAELVHIATDPRSERRGHALALVRAICDELRLDLLVAETDEDAVEFYRRAGFSVESITSPWPTPRFRCTLRRV